MNKAEVTNRDRQHFTVGYMNIREVLYWTPKRRSMTACGNTCKPRLLPKARVDDASIA